MLVGCRQSHKIFVGGLPANANEGELVRFFEKAGGPIADCLVMKVRVILYSIVAYC
jgi:RNA recognition motif-containing protein